MSKEIAPSCAPCTQLARSLPWRSAAVASGHARSECLRAIAAGTNTSLAVEPGASSDSDRQSRPPPLAGLGRGSSRRPHRRSSGAATARSRRAGRSKDTAGEDRREPVAAVGVDDVVARRHVVELVDEREPPLVPAGDEPIVFVQRPQLPEFVGGCSWEAIRWSSWAARRSVVVFSVKKVIACALCSTAVLGSAAWELNRLWWGLRMS